MSHRSRHGKMPLTKAICGLLVLGLFIPLFIAAMNPLEQSEVEIEIHIEGVITEKNIERGFGSAYIFVINGTTDLQVNRWQYDYFLVGDYIIVYIIFLGYELERR